MQEVQAREDTQAASSVDDGIHIGGLASHGHEMHVLVLKLAQCFDDKGEVLALLDAPDKEDVAVGKP